MMMTNVTMMTMMIVCALLPAASSFEPCVLPNRILHRLTPGPSGAMVVQFSHKGHFLAVAGVSRDTPLAGSSSSHFTGHASPYRGACHSVSLTDPDTGTEVWVDGAAHFGVVYDLQWSLSDRYCVTVCVTVCLRVTVTVCVCVCVCGVITLPTLRCNYVGYFIYICGCDV